MERIKHNHSVGLDEFGTELDPPNPNPRGVHGSDSEEDRRIKLRNINDYMILSAIKNNK